MLCSYSGNSGRACLWRYKIHRRNFWVNVLANQISLLAPQDALNLTRSRHCPWAYKLKGVQVHQGSGCLLLQAHLPKLAWYLQSARATPLWLQKAGGENTKWEVRVDPLGWIFRLIVDKGPCLLYITPEDLKTVRPWRWWRVRALQNTFGGERPKFEPILGQWIKEFWKIIPKEKRN